MEFDESDSRSVQEGLHVGSDKKPDLGLRMECVSPKPRVNPMEWEEKKSGYKKRSKPIRAGFDSDDDEPIGSLFKLKSKRNPRKVKDGVAEKGKDIEVWAEKLVVVNEDLGGMDDTLASFRKKLKGPKKDCGSGITMGRGFGIDVAEPSGQSLNGPVTVGGLAMETEVVEKGQIGEDGYDGSIDKESENRDKEKVKRSKSALKQKKTGGYTGSHDALDSQGLGVCSVHNQKESILGHGKGSNPYWDNNLEDSLSAFFQKAQSESVGKSGGYLRLTQRRATEASQKKIGMRPTSDANMQESPLSSDVLQELSSTSVNADANTTYDTMHGGYHAAILKDSVPNSLLQGPQSCLSACSSKIIRTKDGEVDRQTGGIQEGPSLDLYGSDHLHDGDSEELCSINMKDDSCQEPTSKVGLNNVVDQQPKGLCTIHLSNRDQKICCSSGKDQEACFDDESYHRLCEDTSQETLKQLIGINLEVSAKPPLQYSSPCNKKMNEKTLETGDNSNHLSPELCLNESVTSIQMYCSSGHENQRSDDVPKGTCSPNHKRLSSSGEANGAFSLSITPDRNGSYAEDKQNLPGPEFEGKKKSAVQRAVRKANKRRHGDMAYEGDVDWEILSDEQGFLESHFVEDGDQSSRVREKLNSSSNTVMEAENGGAAAVSAGLKAHAAGPVEKIKFKELLKRKGGLQEYLQCRNHILGLWSKDVTRILPLTECGVSNSPPVDEPPHASLVREIYAFLDQSGYINVGVATEKDRAEPGAMHNFRLLKERKFGEKAGAPDADTDDGVSFILGQVRSSEVPMGVKNGDILDDQNQAAGATIDGKFVTLQAMDLSTRTETDECRARELNKNGSLDAKSPSRMFNVDVLGSNPPCKVVDSGAGPVINPELTKQLCGIQFASNDVIGENHSMQCHSEVRKRIIVIGAGPAGLTAARHLQRQGFSVTVLEARSRIGGRVYTDRSSLSVPVDLGASIITGVEADVATERRPDPSSLICAQLGLELTVLNSDCPLYDIVTGQKVPADLDEALEAEYNSLLDDMVLLVAQKGERAMKMSLEDGLEYALKRRRMARLGRNYMQNELHISTDALVDSEKTSVDCKVSENNSCRDEILSPLERRVMDWHFANLEYGCATLLKKVSLPYWNQDDVYGGFGGAHCMIKGGYSTVVESLGGGLCIHLNHVVKDISYCAKDCRENDDHHNKVKVSTSNGREFLGEAVLITVPLGCLKAEAIKFSPPLPKSKHLSIQRLGFGVLNKVVLEFPEVFWDDSVDYFGATAEETNQRGQCFMFWNVKKTVGAPVLIALVVGKAAIVGENMSPSDHVNHALTVLRKLFGDAAVPDPVASVVTDWGKDPFSYGAYSYVAVGASGEDYDILGRPVENCLFFAGEATCKEHPDTVGGAMMSGLREAVRIGDILNTGNDYTTEVEAMEAAQRHSDSERSEVRDIVKRLEAVELSNLLYKDSLDGPQFFPREALLQDIFSNAKTTPARLHLAKELLNLPVEALKSFAGTKEGLSTLNSWILDSMGKDGTQLLRHCVRLLVLVSTDLFAVRLSGIGKTVKEKVCVHTSRDIRAIASQLVNVWIEVFRKEKASNGGLKLLRHSTAADSLKSKSLASGKPPLRTHHGPPDNKGSSQIFASAGSHLPPSANVKRVNVKPVKLETRTDSKLEVKLTRSQGSIGREDAKGEEDYNFVMSEEEQAAFAAAETARAAALAAAEAYASSEAKCNTSLPLPKILSFHKFARREQHTQMDETDIRRKWSGGALGRQDCISEIDSRNCRVRDWSVDFSAACGNLDSTKMSLDNLSQWSHSNEIACQLNFGEHSGESAAVDSSIFTKAWVDAAGSVGIKDYNAIDRWQSQAAAANSDFFHRTMQIRDEEDSNMYSKLPTWRHEQLANESSVSQVTVNKELVGNQPREVEHIKQAVVDYVASLLMPIYKAKKIEKEGYKSIMKKTATKVMEQTTDAEKTMPVYEFLDFKRKNKIRSFVDKLIERHMTMKPVVKP